MKLRRIRLQDFRNIESAALEFAGDRTFFLGANGQGKTNLLEAIGFATALRAFRPGDNRTLIRHDAAEAALAFAFEHETLGRSELLVRIRARGKEAAFDGNPVRRLGDFIGRFPTVLFASEDVQLVRGAPASRRRLLDLHLASLDPDYLSALQNFHRALESRNRLLKDGADAQALAAFEQQLAPAAVAVVALRRAGVAALAPFVRESYASLSAGAEEAAIEYRADVEAAGTGAFLEMLERQHARDVQMKSTQRGPHRDDLAFSISGRAAALFASEGQQRALVLALRFAQLRDARRRSGVAPLVLADDVLGELDPERRARFWSALDKDVQLFATGTTPPSGHDHDWQIFRVSAGRFNLPPSAGDDASQRS
jgi:DNA replication and repair protein RecF